MKSNLIKFIQAILVPAILGGILGGLLACMGYPIITWQFWAVMCLATGMMVYGMLTKE